MAGSTDLHLEPEGLLFLFFHSNIYIMAIYVLLRGERKPKLSSDINIKFMFLRGSILTPEVKLFLIFLRIRFGSKVSETFSKTIWLRRTLVAF